MLVYNGIILMKGGMKYMSNQKNDKKCDLQSFSKDNHILEISSKQSQVQIKNIKPPIKPKEVKKTE